MKSVLEGDVVLARSRYLVQVALTLGVPVIATTQNMRRLGPVHPLLDIPSDCVLDKMSFSVWRDPAVKARIQESQRDQIVILGVETHICVGLTVNDLVEQGFEVAVCADAASARTRERHELGMDRICEAGAIPAHTESVAYEWVSGAGDPDFKTLLALTKEFQ